MTPERKSRITLICLVTAIALTMFSIAFSAGRAIGYRSGVHDGITESFVAICKEFAKIPTLPLCKEPAK